MSYFKGSPSGDISEWNNSISMLLEQGYPASTISLAIPYFFGNTAWADLCGTCPDIAPHSNNCSGTTIVGKLMNERLGVPPLPSPLFPVCPVSSATLPISFPQTVRRAQYRRIYREIVHLTFAILVHHAACCCRRRLGCGAGDRRCLSLDVELRQHGEHWRLCR
eukprot:SAG11_NODE_2931_length_2830_cov_2.053094_3_plen_164_part_00